jgi:hypothetical protein
MGVCVRSVFSGILNGGILIALDVVIIYNDHLITKRVKVNKN